MNRSGTAPTTARMWHRHVALLWIVLAALCAVSPLLMHGASCGHDLSFHLLNWMEVASQWRQGVLRPFWCFHAAWNAGEPRFVFYPPMSWSLGAVVGTALPWAATPVVYTFFALLLCGLTMHRLLRDFVPAPAAVLGACMYLANPYALFTAFERTAYAELLAAAWVPLLLRAVLSKRLSILQLALPTALFWLTNAPAAVAASYSLLLLGTVRCLFTWREPGRRDTWKNAGKMMTGYALGLGLAGFFLLPAIVQRRFVQIDMAVLPGMRPTDNLLFARSGEPLHDAVLHQASLLALVLLSLAIACAEFLLWKNKRHHAWRSMHDRQASLVVQTAVPRQQVAMSLGLLSLAVFFLLTPLSAAVWHHAPQLSFLQFPWRFLIMAGPAATLLAAMVVPTRLRTGAAVSIALSFALAAGWGAHALYGQSCDEDDTPAAQRAIFQRQTGSEPTDEYTPSAADNESLKSGLPAAWTATAEDGAPTAETAVLPVEGGRPNRLDFVTRPLAQRSYLVVRLRQFAGWHVIVDGTEQTTHSQRNDGLLAVPLAPGAAHRVQVRYRWTWDESLGLALTTGSGGVVLLLARRRNRNEPALARQRLPVKSMCL